MGIRLACPPMPLPSEVMNRLAGRNEMRSCAEEVSEAMIENVSGQTECRKDSPRLWVLRARSLSYVDSRSTLRDMPTKKRILIVVAMVVVIIAIVSSTLGREIVSGRQPGIASFAIIHFAGYLFFLLMPVEALVPYYQAEGHAAMTLVLISVATATAAQLIDYGIGYAISDKFLRDLIGDERYAKAKRAMDKWGGYAIVFFNLFPLSSPNLLLVCGMMRYGLRRAIPLSVLGLTTKYVAIVLGFGGIARLFGI